MSPFWANHVQFRPVTGQAPWIEYDSTTSETMYWFRYDDPPCDEHGRLDPFALRLLPALAVRPWITPLRLTIQKAGGSPQKRSNEKPRNSGRAIR